MHCVLVRRWSMVVWLAVAFVAVAQGVAVAADKPAAIKKPDSRGVLDLTFDDIKFEMEKGGEWKRSMLTPAVEEYVGSRIRIRGYILPTFQQTGITQFVLVRDNMECCFGPGAALYDCIIVEMKPGKSVEYTTRPITVEGTFGLKEMFGPDDKHLAIYHLEGESGR